MTHELTVRVEEIDDTHRSLVVATFSLPADRRDSLDVFEIALAALRARTEEREDPGSPLALGVEGSSKERPPEEMVFDPANLSIPDEHDTGLWRFNPRTGRRIS